MRPEEEQKPEPTLGSETDLDALARATMVGQPLALIKRRRADRGAQYDAPNMIRGFLIVGAIVIVVVGAVFIGRALGPSAPTYRWTWSVVPQYLPFLAQGLGLTLFLSVVTIVCGMILGILVAAAKLSSYPPLQVFITGYIEVMRGTPLLVQLVWAYYCLPIVTGLQLPPVASVLVALILNMGAFYGEAFRAGLQSIPRQEVESANVLGLSYWQQMRYILVPQTFRIILPVLISMSISLFKDTSLVAIVGLADLMYNGLSASVSTYRPLEILTVVAIFYFAVAFPATLILRRLELHLMKKQ
ncbi:MAG: amino acid ABC transporter permease [Microbacteriaceae bacterium]